VAKIGRPKGSMNKKTVGMVVAQREGISPLEFLLNVMDDEDLQLPQRIDAAKSAAPYCHARLAQIAMEVEGEVVTKLERTIVHPKPANS